MPWDGQTCKKCGSPHTWNVEVSYGRWGIYIEWHCDDCYHTWKIRRPGTYKLEPEVNVSEDGKVIVEWDK